MREIRTVEMTAGREECWGRVYSARPVAGERRWLTQTVVHTFRIVFLCALPVMLTPFINANETASTLGKPAIQRIVLDVKSTPLTEVLLQIQKQSQARLIWETEMKDVVSVRLVNVTLDQALDLLLGPRGYGWQKVKAPESEAGVDKYRIFKRENQPTPAHPFFDSNQWRCSAVKAPNWDTPEFNDESWQCPAVLVEDGHNPEMGLSFPLPQKHKALYLRNTFSVSMGTTQTTHVPQLQFEVFGNGSYSVKVNGATLGRGHNARKRFDISQTVLDGRNVLAIEVTVTDTNVIPLLMIRWLPRKFGAEASPAQVTPPGGSVWQRIHLLRLDARQLALLLTNALRGGPGSLRLTCEGYGASITLCTLPDNVLAVGGTPTDTKPISHLVSRLDQEAKWDCVIVDTVSYQAARLLFQNWRPDHEIARALPVDLLSVALDSEQQQLLALGTEEAVRRLKQLLSPYGARRGT